MCSYRRPIGPFGDLADLYLELGHPGSVPSTVATIQTHILALLREWEGHARGRAGLPEPPDRIGMRPLRAARAAAFLLDDHRDLVPDALAAVAELATRAENALLGVSVTVVANDDAA